MRDMIAEFNHDLDSVFENGYLDLYMLAVSTTELHSPFPKVSMYAKKFDMTSPIHGHHPFL